MIRPGSSVGRWQSDRSVTSLAELCHVHPHSNVPEMVLPITHSLDFIVPAYAQNDNFVARTQKLWPHKMTFRHVSTLKIIMWCNKSHQRQERSSKQSQGAACTSKVPLEPSSKLCCPRPFIKGSALKALNGDSGDYGVPAIKQLLGRDFSPNESRDGCLIDSVFRVMVRLMDAVDTHFPDPERCGPCFATSDLSDQDKDDDMCWWEEIDVSCQGRTVLKWWNCHIQCTNAMFGSRPWFLPHTIDVFVLCASKIS